MYVKQLDFVSPMLNDCLVASKIMCHLEFSKDAFS